MGAKPRARPSSARPAPEAEGPEVTVVVVTHNSAELLAAFFAALPSALSGVNGHEVVVADNLSRDGTLELVTELQPGATLVDLGRNAGYAAGINAAIRRASGNARAVLVCNPDVRLHSGSVRRLLDGLTHPGVGIAVPRLLESDGRLALSLRREPRILRALGEALVGGTRAGWLTPFGEVVCDPRRYERPGCADWACGAVMLISRRCLESVGPWDETFFLYSEETEFALRARDAGFALRYVPDAVATHLGGDRHVSSQLWTLLTINRVRLYSRRNGRLRTATFWAVVTLNEALRALAGRAAARAALPVLLRPRSWAARTTQPRAEGVPATP
ncbi:MAG: glycosyltransferase family 2 protein [Actinomycetota bacterium]|nr:glycosyltransferase family 2 protein [Actinomycetota bacterium]